MKSCNLTVVSKPALEVIVVKKALKKLIDELETRRAKKEGGTGTIWLKSMQEFRDVCDYFESAVVSPGGAADMLGVSRAMISHLEKEGKIRVYRYIVRNDDEELVDEPYYVRVLLGVKGQYGWIPIADIVRYAISVGRGDRPTIKGNMEYYEADLKREEWKPKS